MSRVQPQVPAALERIIISCLTKDPDQRWQSAADVARNLRWIAAEGASSAHAISSPSAPRRYLAWLLASVAVVAAVLLSAPGLRHPVQGIPVVRFDVVTPATADPTSLALSPDGEALVFVAGAGADARLWLRRLDQTTAKPLEGTNGATFPFWSPDSHSVAFFAGGKLKRVSVAGGTPQTVAEAATGQGGTWIAMTSSCLAEAPTG